MKNKTKYSYKFRPGYGTKELLLDINCKGAPDALQIDLLKIINDANFTIVGVEDLWMNDELLFEFKSKNGTIVITRDIWDLFFVVGNHNQIDMMRLDKILSENPLFEKLEVNFSDYE